MKFKGLTKSTAPHFAESASHFADFSQADPNCATSWSATINPMLCRVAAYSEPGFPRPATSRIAVSSTRGVSGEPVILSGAKRSRRIPQVYLTVTHRDPSTPLGMTTVTSSLSLLELFLSQLEQAQ